jgi:hypothetical protein
MSGKVEPTIFATAEGQYFPLAEAGRRLGQILGDKPLPPCTMYRWVHKGTSGFRLDAVCLGGRWYVSEAAIARFVANVTQARVGSPDRRVSPRGSSSRRAERVAHELDALGL